MRTSCAASCNTCSTRTSSSRPTASAPSPAITASIPTCSRSTAWTTASTTNPANRLPGCSEAIPTGAARSGQWMSLWEVAAELSRRLNDLFLRNRDGRRPVFGNLNKFQADPHWRDLVLFHEYFHGDDGRGVGASHQTGWTGLLTKLMQQSGEKREPGASDTKELAAAD